MREDNGLIQSESFKLPNDFSDCEFTQPNKTQRIYLANTTYGMLIVNIYRLLYLCWHM